MQLGTTRYNHAINGICCLNIALVDNDEIKLQYYDISGNEFYKCHLVNGFESVGIYAYSKEKNIRIFQSINTKEKLVIENAIKVGKFNKYADYYGGFGYIVNTYEEVTNIIQELGILSENQELYMFN